MERRIYTLTHQSGNSIDSFTPVFPKPPRPTIKPAPPTIRIVLSPSMTTYVVQCSQVETWEDLHKTVQRLLGPDVFGNGRPLRFTDPRGTSVVPSKWKEYMQTNMTVVVETGGGFLKEDTAALLNTFPLPRRSRSRSPSRPATQKSPAQKSNGGIASGLQRRYSEDSLFDTPTEYDGPTALTVPGGSLKTRPMPAWEGWSSAAGSDAGQDTESKSRASVTVYATQGNTKFASAVETIKLAPSPIIYGNRKQSVSIELDLNEESFGPGAEKTSPGPAAPWDTTETSKPSKKMKLRARIRRAVTLLLPGHHGSKDQPAVPNLPNSSKGTDHAHRQCGFTAIGHRGIPTAPLLNSASAAPNPRRSRSLGSLPSDALSKYERAPADNKPTLQSLTNPPTPSTPVDSSQFSSLTRTLSSTKRSSRTLTRKSSLRSSSTSEPRRNTSLSPPVPQRPVEELAINAQYKAPVLDRYQIMQALQEMRTSGANSVNSTPGRSADSAISMSPPTNPDKPLPELPGHSRNYISPTSMLPRPRRSVPILRQAPERSFGPFPQMYSSPVQQTNRHRYQSEQPYSHR